MSETDRLIRRVVIVGGGTAGWMSAAMLSHVLKHHCSIVLVESDEIGIVGVGEATIPTIRGFNDTLGICEADFVRETKASFKLGIEFVNWGREGQRYFHPFGSHARPFDIVALHHYWLRARAQGDMSPLDDHAMAWAIAKEHRMGRPSSDPSSVLSTFDYAYHFDAGLYAGFLRRFAEARGVERVEGKISDVALDSETGFVTKVILGDGRTIGADFFLDCSGFRRLLIEGALKTDFIDWSQWLACDRALAVACQHADGRGMDITPFTRSTALEAGWQWRIPLQHRMGNGHVYVSALMDDTRAADILLRQLDGTPLGDPRMIAFKAGTMRAHWVKNVVAIGLASGFLEPLESTAIHLIQANIAKLMALFPDKNCDPALRGEFNRIAMTETERIRDFIILHYKLTARRDSELWRQAAAMEIPDSLALKIEHFRKSGRLIARDMDLFAPASWLSVHIGQGNIPEDVDPLLDYRDIDARGWLAKLRGAMTAEASRLPTHRVFLEQLIQQKTS